MPAKQTLLEQLCAVFCLSLPTPLYNVSNADTGINTDKNYKIFRGMCLTY